MRRASFGVSSRPRSHSSSAVRRIRTAPLGSFITPGRDPLLAPAVEGGARYPQLSDDLLDRQQLIRHACLPPSLPGSPPYRRDGACPCPRPVRAVLVHARSGLARWSSPRDDTPPAMHAGQRPARPRAAPCAAACARAAGPAPQGGRAGPGPCGPHSAGVRASPAPGRGAEARGRPATRAAPPRAGAGKTAGLDVPRGVGRGSATVHDRHGRPPRAGCPCRGGTSPSPDPGGA